MEFGVSYPSRAKLVLNAAKTASQVLTVSSYNLLTWESPTLLQNFTESSDVFTCTVPGTYLFEFSLVKSADSSTRRYYPYIYKNGSVFQRLGGCRFAYSTTLDFNSAKFSVELEVGDTVSFYAFPSGVTGGFTCNSGAYDYYSLQGYWISGFGAHPTPPSRPKLLAAVTSQSYTLNTQTILALDAPSVNTAGFTESSDVFTCTIPGVYSIRLQISTAVSGIYWARLQIYKNGSLVRSGQFMERISLVECFLDLAVGDTISAYIYTFTTNTLVADSLRVLEVVAI